MLNSLPTITYAPACLRRQRVADRWATRRPSLWARFWAAVCR